jgi:DUF971 family protein
MILPTPTKIERVVKKNTTLETVLGTGLNITWSDGTTCQLDSATLRTNCPCATCLEVRGDKTHAKPLSVRSSRLNILTATKDEETDLRKITPIGNYAISLLWGDKHDSGIYTYSLLFELCFPSTINKEVISNA